MIPVLVLEIVSALVALVIVVIMLVKFVASKRRGTSAIPAQDSSPRSKHQRLSMVLIVAVLVHGVCAMVYASGANPLAYVLGWLALVALAASGICMAPPLRAKLPHAATAHSGLFICAIVLIVGHAIAGRL